jgi:hypothetical protein
MLTQAQVLDLFDYKDGNLYWRKSSGSRAKIGAKVGCRDKHLYTRVGINGKLYWLHRVIFLHQHGYMPHEVDHINGDPTDNRIENLRAATKSQNMQNKRCRSDSSSGVKNVYWNNKLDKWVVRMRVEGKLTHIGVFEDIELANFVASEYRDKYHGEFANHG